MSASTVEKSESKSRGSSKYKVYSDLEAIAEKPLSKRPKLAIGRGGRQTIARKYHLTDDEVTAFKAELTAGDALPNPNNKGVQRYAIEALKGLGLNRNHSWTRFTEKFKELASAVETKNKAGKTFWQVFKAKEPRNPATGLNWEGRLEQTLEVMQRLGGKHPYGRKLIDIGQKVLGTNGVTIDIVYGSTGEMMVHLNTNSDTPRNDTKRQPKTEEQKVAAKAAKATAKAEKATKPYTGKKRGRKPKSLTGPIVPTTADGVTEETVPAVEAPFIGEPAAVPFETPENTVTGEAPASQPVQTEAPEAPTVAETAV